jgi:hypothetical protein
VKTVIIFLFSLFVFSLSLVLIAQTSLDQQVTTEENSITPLCNRETAYSTGVSDARKGLAHKDDYGQLCPVNRMEFNNAYDTGYNFGLNNPAGIIVNVPAPYHPEIPEQLPAAVAQPYTRPITGIVGGGPGPGTTYTAPSILNRRGGAVLTSEPQNEEDIYTHGQESVGTQELRRPSPVDELKPPIVEIRPEYEPKCITTAQGQACGYNCVNSMGNVRCAATPGQICKGDDFGHIACGYHCIAGVDHVKCAARATDECVLDMYGHIYCGVNCKLERNGQAFCEIERYGEVYPSPYPQD